MPGRKRDQQRHNLASGGDPSSVRRTAAVEASVGATNSFEAVAQEWMAKQKKWKASTRAKAKWLLETYAFPWIGTRPIAEITPMDMLTLLRRPEALGKIETAHRLKQRCGHVFRYAIATGRAARDQGCPHPFLRAKFSLLR
jgi:integrase